MHWKKYSVLLLAFIALALLVTRQNGRVSDVDAARKSREPSSSVFVNPEGSEKLSALKNVLPKFEDYPSVASEIPPRPKFNLNSDPMAMRYRTFLESLASRSGAYTMAGHYLMERYGTGNPYVLIVDGLTGQVFHEYGGEGWDAVSSSSLVVFDPFDLDCFSPDGDYDRQNPPAGCPTTIGGNPRYAEWTGKRFKAVCAPVIRGWKLVSCD